VRGPDVPAAAAAAALAPPRALAQGARVILIGIDGADWRTLDALRARGAVPALDRLIRSGVAAPLHSFQPTWSPILWTTIATGVEPERHGVLDFSETPLPGLSCGVQRLRKEPRLVPAALGVRALADVLFRLRVLHEIPVTSCQRRAKALWNAIGEAGLRVATINWFASWPAEPLAGYVVSDNNPVRAAFLAGRHREVLETLGSTWGATHPPELLAELSDLAIPPELDDPTDLLEQSIFDDLDESERAELEAEPGRLRTFRHIQRSDAFAARSALRLLERQELDFLAVYLSGIDNVSHRLGGRTGVVERYYAWTDALIAPILARADEHTTIVLVSDHGWDYAYPELWGHEHAPDGVFVISGPGALRGLRLPPETAPSLYDVAPTVLALLGLPADRAMPGTAVAAALAPEPLRWAAAERVAYGPYTGPRLSSRDARSSAELHEETMEKLRGLGYIE
jgi:hypothetical protein